MKILVIDNYDSFTFNLVQLLGRYEDDIVVKRNDEISVKEISDMKPDKILISPGPGKPEDANVSVTAIEKFGDKIPIMGVCLGHQVIGMVYGANVVKAPALMHGKTSYIFHDGRTIFSELEQGFNATRYHSLIVESATVSGDLEISARTQEGLVMGIRHKKFSVEGIQFHPESILTKEGYNIIKNWLKQ